MDRKPKSAKKTLKAKQMKSVKGGALNAYISKPQGEKQGVIAIKEVTGLKMEQDVIE